MVPALVDEPSFQSMTAVKSPAEARVLASVKGTAAPGEVAASGAGGELPGMAKAAVLAVGVPVGVRAALLTVAVPLSEAVPPPAPVTVTVKVLLPEWA